MSISLYLFLGLTILAICPYIPELFLILRLHQKRPRIGTPTRIKQIIERLPRVSIILPVCNEEKLIEQKIRNLLEADYPKDLMEIIVVDGNSSDNTVDLVKKFEQKGLELIEQKEREGVTDAVKKGVEVSTGEIIIMTDAEPLFEPTAIRATVEDFEDPRIGAVNGHQVLSNPARNVFTKMEQTYGSFHEEMRLAESAFCSTSHFKGELIGIRKDLFPFNINPNKGVLDAGIAFNTIRNGYRAICDESIIFYDIATDNLKDRNRQKIQRGTLLQQTILQNADMLFNRKFGNFGLLVFPSTFFIYTLSPVLFLASVAVFPLVILELVLQYPLITLSLITLLGVAMVLTRKALTFFLTFLHSQVVLVIGLMRIAFQREQKFVRQVEGTRKSASVDQCGARTENQRNP